MITRVLSVYMDNVLDVKSILIGSCCACLLACGGGRSHFPQLAEAVSVEAAKGDFMQSIDEAKLMIENPKALDIWLNDYFLQLADRVGFL